jgi:hypothetical protein
LRAWESTLGTFRRIHDQCTQFRLEHHALIYNVALYILLLEHDLASLGDDMVHATNDWRRKFVARQMAALLYEAIEDLPALLGTRMRHGLTELRVDSSLVSELNSIMKLLNQFKAEHATELQQLRNLVGAHRDHDAGAQLRILDDLQPLTIFGLQASFYVPFRQLVGWLTKLTTTTGRLNGVFEQFLKRRESSN